MFEYSGSIHIHSRYSDGTGTVEEIAAAASESGLDFIILTDHNTLKAKEKGFEKWYHGTMLIVGYEVNDSKNKNHYLAFGIDEVVGSFMKLKDGDLGNKLSAPEYVRKVKESGGIGFIAHPDEKRRHLDGHPAYPWTAWESEDFDGLEIWNHMSEWAEGLNDSNKVNRFIHPLKSIISPPEETLKRWDELNQKRKVVALGGIDAHAHKHTVMGITFEIFSYKILFKSIRTHVILEKELQPDNPDEFEEGKKRIIDALGKGRSFVVNNYNGSGRGFRFAAEYEGKHYICGDEIQLEKKKSNFILRALLPSEARVRLIKDGVCADEQSGMDFIWDSDEPGNYRVEAWKGNRGWIFSNHIRVLKPS